MSKWDVSDINKWKSDQFPRGAVIPIAGNSDDYVTGGWRSERPYRDDEKCTQCLLVLGVLPRHLGHGEGPEGLRLRPRALQGLRRSVLNECPVDAIDMVPEGCELPGVK